MIDFVVDSINLSEKSDCYVIAEIRNNHMGSLENSFKLIEAAKKSGASAVKFQKRDNKTLFSDKLLIPPTKIEIVLEKLMVNIDKMLNFLKKIL